MKCPYSYCKGGILNWRGRTELCPHCSKQRERIISKLAPKDKHGNCLCGNCVGDRFDMWLCNET